MGSISDAFTSGLSGAPVGGSSSGNDFGAGGIGGGGGTPSFDFSSFNNIIDALSGGSGPTAANASQFTAQAPAAALDAQSGTQSNVSPGGSQQNQQQQQQPNAQQPQAIPADAIQKLNDLLSKLKGEPTGPTGFVPQPPRTPTIPGMLSGIFNADARTPPPGEEGRNIGVRARAKPIPPDPTIAAGGPGAGAAPPAPDAPVPAPAPAPAVAPGDKSLQPPADGSHPEPPPPTAPAGPIQAQPHQMSRLMRDIQGISTGNLASLADLALALYGVGAPLAIAMGKGGRPGVDYAGGYGEALDMTRHAMGDDAAAGRQKAIELGLTDKNGNPSPHGTFDRNGSFVGSPDKTPVSNQIPGVTPQIVDDAIRQTAQKYHIDPNVASKMLGAESSYGQNNLGDYVNGRPTSFGPLQLHHAADGNAMGDQFQRDTGMRPEDFAQNWKQQIDYTLGKAAKEGWGPWQTSMKKLGLDQWSGIPHYFGGGPQKPVPITTTPTKAGGGFTLPGEHAPVS